MMKMVLFVLIFLPTVIYAQDFQDLRWKKRVLVIAGRDFSDHQIQKQFSLLLAQKGAWNEYKLLVVQRTNEGERRDLGKIDVTVVAEEITGFKVYLIGLDGEVKFESKEVQPAHTFFEIINTMPMRRSELKKG